jgi:VWFA-related protein
MRKIIFFTCLYIVSLLFPCFSFPQEEYEVFVTNIMVPVRVYEEDRFVADLTLQDLELYEDGKLQEIKALYLTRDNHIERTDAERDYMPILSRRFYFLFQTLDFNPKITDAIEHFFYNIFQPGDVVVVQTPIKVYTLSPDAVQKSPKETLIKDMQAVIRKDTQIGAIEYNNLLDTLKRNVRMISSVMGDTTTMRDIESGGGDVTSGNIPLSLMEYRETLQKMEQLRVMHEKWFLRFAAQLRKLEQQKVVFFFYQREYRPEISSRVMNRLITQYADSPSMLSMVQELFQTYHREINFDYALLERAFADSDILFNFIFMSKTPDASSGLSMREQSEDVFKLFSSVSEATGGVVDNSQNPAAAFKRVADISESYYILYYSPKEYTRDGKFKKIEVKIKNRSCKVIHRLGYFAD